MGVSARLIESIRNGMRPRESMISDVAHDLSTGSRCRPRFVVYESVGEVHLARSRREIGAVLLAEIRPRPFRRGGIHGQRRHGDRRLDDDAVSPRQQGSAGVVCRRPSFAPLGFWHDDSGERYTRLLRRFEGIWATETCVVPRWRSRHPRSQRHDLNPAVCGWYRRDLSARRRTARGCRIIGLRPAGEDDVRMCCSCDWSTERCSTRLRAEIDRRSRRVHPDKSRRNRASRRLPRTRTTNSSNWQLRRGGTAARYATPSA